MTDPTPLIRELIPRLPYTGACYFCTGELGIADGQQLHDRCVEAYVKKRAGDVEFARQLRVNRELAANLPSRG
jgi:hypothetical protein